MLLLVISLFKIAPKHNAEVLSGVSKYKKTMMYLKEKIGMLDKPHRAVHSWLLAVHEFNVNE